MSGQSQRTEVAGLALRNFLRRARHALRPRGPLANDPTAQTLHALLVGIAAWLVFLFVVDVPNVHRRAGNAALDCFLSLAVSAALLLLYRGLLRAASLVYLYGSWLVFTLLIIFNGGIHSVAVVFYVAVTISAAWLLGYQAALWSAAVCLASSLTMAILELNGIRFPLYFPGPPLGIWNALVGAMVISAVPVARVMQTLKKTLAQSREAEAELRQHREHLEELVQQRTAELVEARDQAQAANRAKTVFLANMSHELRTPLNAILGFSAMVRADASLPDRHRQDLAVVGKSGEHLLVLIDDVLDMAKIETGSVSVESGSFDLHALVNDAVNMMRERAQAKNLELLVDVSSQAPRFVRTDPGKLRQVLVNLVGNAVKYTDEGSVVVRVDAKADNSQGLVLTFEVEDTGIGIAPEDQARIFDPFVQAGGMRTRKGTGLGLSISRRFVELMGGTIQVESTPGQGSRFRVEVPAQAAEAAEAASVEEVAGLEPGQADYRILIVEDQRENWLLLERLLRGAGFQTRVAEDGVQAIEAFREWRPHFIWMDVRLPVLGGLEATKRIRELEGGRGVKIVAVTASVSASEREDVLAAGMDDFVRKPYRHGEIFDCMARHLGVRYVYAAKPETTTGDVPPVLRPEDLAALPAALRKELERAVISLDREWIGRLVDQISEQNASLGRVLANLADAFAYTPILRALQGSKSKLVGASA